MFRQLTKLKSILVALNTDDKTPHSSGHGLDINSILWMHLLYLILVDVPSTDNTKEYPSSNTDDNTPPSSWHG